MHLQEEEVGATTQMPITANVLSVDIPKNLIFTTGIMKTMLVYASAEIATTTFTNRLVQNHLKA
jgi:hypothetical protein